METTYRYESMPDGSTRMTLRNRATGFGLLAPFVRAAMRRAAARTSLPSR